MKMQGTKMQTIGVVGVGVIGTGVVQLFATHGYNVIAIDLTNERLQQSQQCLIESLRMSQLFLSKKHDQNIILERITWGIDLSLLGKCDLVIENVTEDFSVKRSVYEKINHIVNEHTYIGVNTSCIPIGKIASIMSYRNNILGLHFMNPVPMKKAIEVIRAETTSDQTLQIIVNLLQKMDKKCIIVEDRAGFVINRILMLTINQAIKVFDEEVADAKSIDDLFVSCLGHSMGPLATADLIGLDTIYHSLLVLRNELKDTCYKPSNLLKTMVENNWLGRKTGQGFFSYTQ